MKNIFTLALFLLFAGNLTYAQTTLLIEDFEDGTVSYVTSIPEFTDGAEDYFIRTDGSNITNETFSNIQDSYYFTAQDIDGEGAASEQTLTFSGININGYTNIMFSTFLAEDATGSSNHYDDTNDFVLFEYQIDGGGYQNLLRVDGEDGPTGTNNIPRIDTDFDGFGDGAEITNVFTQFSNGIPATGTTLDLRITINFNAGNEDIAIDNILIEGEQVVDPIPTMGQWGLFILAMMMSSLALGFMVSSRKSLGG